MEHVSVLGVDTSKASFTLYGVDQNNKKVLSKTLTRSKFKEFMVTFPKTKVIIEACGASHYWGQTLSAYGHEVKLIAPQKVKPFVQGNKNDNKDARGIVAASLSPEMTFVSIKDRAQQDLSALHAIRESKVKTQTMLTNQIRGILGEYGIIMNQGPNCVRGFLAIQLESVDCELSPMLKNILTDMHKELLTITEHIERLDKYLEGVVKNNEFCRRLMEIDGIGVITATAVVASVPDFSVFKNGRQFAASLGLTPGHRQTGGKDNAAVMLGITKKGNTRLRSLLVQGGMSVARLAATQKILPSPEPTPEPTPELSDLLVNDGNSKNTMNSKGKNPCRKRKKPAGTAGRNGKERRVWLKQKIDTRGIQKAAVAFANKNARIIFALAKTGQSYNPSVSKAA